MARFRVGNHADALAALATAADRSEELAELVDTDIAPLTAYQDSVRMIFLAMARFQVGQRALAAEAVEDAAVTIETHPELASDRADALELLDEARAMIGSPE